MAIYNFIKHGESYDALQERAIPILSQKISDSTGFIFTIALNESGCPALDIMFMLNQMGVPYTRGIL